MTRRIRWKIPALWCSLGNLTSARLTGYFLTPSVFIVVEAASACKLLLQMCKLLSFLAARASVIERERERERARVREQKRERERERGSSIAAERRIDEFVGRVSATLQHHLPARCLTWVLIQISQPSCTHSKFHPTSGVKFVARRDKNCIPSGYTLAFSPHLALAL